MALHPRRAAPGFAAIALLALAACEGEPPPPPLTATTASRVAPTAGSQSAAGQQGGPVTTFDGRYSGAMTLNPDRTRRCLEAPPGELEIVVRQGRANFIVNPQTRQTLSGTVGRDGQVRMTDIVDRAIATGGVFTATAFVGEYRNGLCSYAVTMRKSG